MLPDATDASTSRALTVETLPCTTERPGLPLPGWRTRDTPWVRAGTERATEPPSSLLLLPLLARLLLLPPPCLVLSFGEAGIGLRLAEWALRALLPCPLRRRARCGVEAEGVKLPALPNCGIELWCPWLRLLSLSPSLSASSIIAAADADSWWLNEAAEEEAMLCGNEWQCVFFVLWCA